MKKLSLFTATTLLFIVMLCFSVSAASNTVKTAKTIKENQTVKITYDEYNDYYYLKFTPTETAEYELSVTNFVYDDTYIYVYDSNGVDFASGDQYDFTDECIATSKLTANKTYYFKIICYTESSKTLKATISKHTHTKFKDDFEPADFKYSGYYYIFCNRCDYCKYYTIPYVKTCKLDDTRFGYNGKTHKPSLVIKDSKGKVLKKGTDYTISGTTSAKELGTYTIKIKLKGNYSGSKSLKYSIVPSSPKNLKFVSSTTNSVTITWDKVKSATGYTVFEYECDEYTKVASVKTNKATIKVPYEAYPGNYVVRAYIKKDGETFRSSYSKIVKTISKPMNLEDFYAKGGSGYAKLEWYDDYGCDGYQVYMSTKKDGTYKKAKSFKCTNYGAVTKKITGLSSGKTYYFKVRAYSKNGDAIAYSNFTPIKSAKIK